MDEREQQQDLRPLPGQTAGLWVREHRWALLFALLLLATIPMRDLWAPDEPDFAQCVKEMRLRGEWLLPYLNGQPYNEKPILFYWMMKASAVSMDWLTGGLGFSKGVAAWALRLPSAIGSVAFLVAFRRWASRFLQSGVADLGVLILASAPIWWWQSHFIQIDMVFSAMLAWAWLCWLGGYLLERGLKEASDPREARRWFLKGYFWLGMATLAKGPLALVLSFLVLAAFLAWQRDGRILGRMGLGWGLLILAGVVMPWYAAAVARGGLDYAFAMIVHQNFERATHAWDHVQPWWRYAEYMLGDFFPWVLLLPALALFLRGSGALRSPAARFLIAAFVAPLLFLSAVQSKQGKYLLMSYPMLALLMAAMLQPVAVEGVSASRIRRLGGLLGTGLALAATVLLIAGFGGGGGKVHAQVAPYAGLVRALGLVAALGALSVLARAFNGEGQFLVRETALTLGLLYAIAGTWGFRLINPQKEFHAWAQEAEPLLAGRKVFFWQTIRSGAMVYTDHLMPELYSGDDLRALSTEERLVTMRREWDEDLRGLDPALRSQFEVLLSRPTGSGELLLLRKRP